jgi:hypothetical protein
MPPVVSNERPLEFASTTDEVESGSSYMDVLSFWVMRDIVRKTVPLLTLLTAMGLLGCSKTTAKKRTQGSTGPAAMGLDQNQPSAKIEVSPHDCKSTPACLEAGHCTQEKGSCVVKRDEDCESAAVCKRDGKCTAAKGQCVVGDTDDCKQSKRCKHKGECVFHNGECVTGKQ